MRATSKRRIGFGVLAGVVALSGLSFPLLSTSAAPLAASSPVEAQATGDSAATAVDPAAAGMSGPVAATAVQAAAAGTSGQDAATAVEAPAPLSIQAAIPGDAWIGSPFPGVLTVTEADSSPVVGLDLSKLAVTPSSSAATVSSVTDHGDGTYSFLVDWEAVGSYTLTVEYDGTTYAVSTVIVTPAPGIGIMVPNVQGTLSVVQSLNGPESYLASVFIPDYASGGAQTPSQVHFSVTGDATFGAGLTSASVLPDSQGRASVELSVFPYTGAPLAFTVSASVNSEGVTIPMTASPLTVSIGASQECMDNPTLTSKVAASADAQPVADGSQAWTATYTLTSSCVSPSYSADQFDVRVFDTSGNPTSDVTVGAVTKVTDTTFRVAFTSRVAGTYTVKTLWVAIGPAVDTIAFAPVTMPTLPVGPTTAPSTAAAVSTTSTAQSIASDTSTAVISVPTASGTAPIGLTTPTTTTTGSIVPTTVSTTPVAPTVASSTPATSPTALTPPVAPTTAPTTPTTAASTPTVQTTGLTPATSPTTVSNTTTAQSTPTTAPTSAQSTPTTAPTTAQSTPTTAPTAAQSTLTTAPTTAQSTPTTAPTTAQSTPTTAPTTASAPPTSPNTPTTAPVGPTVPTTTSSSPTAPMTTPTAAVAPTTVQTPPSTPSTPTNAPTNPNTPTSVPTGPNTPTTAPVGPTVPTTTSSSPTAPMTTPTAAVAPTSVQTPPSTPSSPTTVPTSPNASTTAVVSPTVPTTTSKSPTVPMTVPTTAVAPTTVLTPPSAPMTPATAVTPGPSGSTPVSPGQSVSASVIGEVENPTGAPSSSQVSVPVTGPVVPQVPPMSGTVEQPTAGTGVQTLAPSTPAASIELSSTTLSPGQSLVVGGRHWVPGEQVTITVHSTPIQFPPVTVNPDGSLPSMTVAVPADFEPGTHTLTAVGTRSGTVTMSFQVVAASQVPTGSALSGSAPAGSVSGQMPSASTGGRAVPGEGLGWLVGAVFVVAGLAVAVVRRRRA